MGKPPHDLIGAAEACEMLRVDRATITRWVVSGKLPTVHKMPGKSGAYLFNRADVEQIASERDGAA